VTEMVWVELAPRGGMRQAVAPGTIGREDCDIVVPDPAMSRRHAAVRTLDSGIAIEDLGSTNGTFVNDRRIYGIAELKQGDRVRFGNTVWELQAAPVRDTARSQESAREIA
jgi:pSer/pThr/pTyr-binding forkhead associated (FHA) protein